MRYLQPFSVALLVLAPCLTARPSADEVSVTIVVTAATQDGPLQIVGFRLPEKVGDAPRLVLHSVSQKQIRHFSVEAAVGNPEESARVEAGEKVAVEEMSSGDAFWPHERTVPQNGYREAHESELRSHNLVKWGQQLHSNCLHVAAIVTHVEFADGTRWESTTPRDQAMWKASLRDDSTKSCGHSSVVEDALKQWDWTAGYADMGTPSHQSTDMVQSYTIVCPLRMVGGRLTALCPW